MAEYSLDKAEVERLTERPATWTFAGSTVRGTECRYSVIDRNSRMRNRWEFLLRLPDKTHWRIEVRPVKVPNDKALAGLDRRSLTFMRGTRRGYTQFRYCQLSLAKPSGEGTRDIVNVRDKRRLPKWLQDLGRRLKQKCTVRNTKGTDARTLVVLVRLTEYEQMIRLFMATKAWVLKQGFSLAD